MTCSSERAYYILSCPRCEAEGGAEWWSITGGSYQHRSAWGLNVSYGFTQVSDPDGEQLTCQACGSDVGVEEVDYLTFYSNERSAMRPIAGGDCDGAASTTEAAEEKREIHP